MEELLIFGVGYFMCISICYAMTRQEIEDFLADRSKPDGDDTEYCCDGESDNINDHVWERSGKFEGDMLLNEAQRRVILQEVTSGVKLTNGMVDVTKRWPNRTVVYKIENPNKKMTKEHFKSIENTFKYLETVSCIKFKRYKQGDPNVVLIQGSSKGCFSRIGMQGGIQVLNLNSSHPPNWGCFANPTLVHELLHTLGFYHMHSSSSRDDHIEISWENIKEKYKKNFLKVKSSLDFGVGYDISSVLHYSPKAYSANGKATIVPKQPVPIFGTRGFVSHKDIVKLNKMYMCEDKLNFFK